TLFPLTARCRDMGNRMCRDMGNTFSAPGRLGAPVTSGGRTSAHLVANPAFWASRGLRRGVQKFLFNMRDSLGTTRECNPCLCTQPTPALSPGERENYAPIVGGAAHGFCGSGVEKGLAFARCSLSPGERVRVRGKQPADCSGMESIQPTAQ